MLEGLTKKQRGFVKDYAETGNGTQSAMNHYDVKNENVARAIGSENLTKPAIQEALRSIAEQIPDEDLVKVHKEGLSATDGERPDYSVRHKYLDSAYKLKGIYAPDRAIQLNMNANVADPKALEIAKRYEEELKNGL